MITIVHNIRTDNIIILKSGITMRAFWIRNGAGSVRYWTNGERFGL